MHTELKKDDALLQKKSSDRHGESRSHLNQDSDLLSGESTEGFTSSPIYVLPPLGQGQLVMQCKGLSENPEPTQRSGPLIQRRVNNTGLPDNLKNGIENLSGYSMDDVKVHYNSSKPAQLRAHAYTQGTAIHVAPGLEKEADAMGAKALRAGGSLSEASGEGMGIGASMGGVQNPSVIQTKLERKKNLNPRFNRSFAHVPVPNLGNPPPTLNRPWQTIQTGDDVHAAAASGIAGSGGTLPHFNTIQRAFGGHNVSGIRAHVGNKAAEACESINAEAYATAGQVAFKSSPTLHTAAHEAAHIIQQRGGVALKGGVGQVNDSYEQCADAVADAVVAGRSAESLLGPVKSSGGPEAAVQHRTVQLRPRYFNENTYNKDEFDHTSPTGAFINNKDNTMGFALVEGSASTAANSDLEEKAQKFEDNLGKMAVSHPSATKAAGLLSKRVSEILVKWAKALRIANINRQAQNEMVNEVLKNILGTPKKTVAGAVGINPANIRAAITEGNLREQMTVLFNFSGFNKEFLKKSNEKAKPLFLTELDGNSRLRKRLKSLKPKDRLVSDSEKGEVGKQANTRGESASGEDLSHRSVASARNQGVDLSDREVETMGLGRGDIEQEVLTWSEGNRKWLINEENEWVNKARKASLPVKAGPSGTTDRLMQLREMLRVSTPIDTRAACIGYLLPINAHSLIEILEAASLHGCPKPVYGPKVYGTIKPFSEDELERQAPDDTFWQAVKP